MNKQARRSAGWVLAAVAGAVVSGMLGADSFAQYRVGSDGHARDANNKIGSGGLNTPISQQLINGNNIVTGNVTGGREFRGFVPYTDPTAFRGATAGFNVDSFTRQSAGVPIGIYNNNNAGVVTSFYGDARAVAPPPGTAQQALGQSSYVPAPVTGRTSGDLRLGNPFNDVFSVEQPRPGQLMMAGPVDPSTNQPTVITASPLYGVRQWRFGDDSDEQFLSSYTDTFNSGPRRSAQLDRQDVERMRSELASQVEPVTPDAAKPLQPINRAAEGADGQTQTNTPGDLSRPLNNGFDKTGDPGLSNKPLDSSSGDGSLQSGLSTNQNVRSELLTSKRITIAQNSPAYRALQDRFKQYQNNSQVAQAEQNREFQRERRALEQIEKGGGAQPGGPAGAGQAGGPGGMGPGGAGAPGGIGTMPPGPGGAGPAGPGGAGAQGAMPDGKNPAELFPGVGPAQATPADTGKPKPIQINSLAKDMKSSATTDLMKEAEELMKAGRFTSALDKYDMVEQVTPNDPLVSLGRATAELGASYYQRADAHLREAFTKNPELLGGQYDLRAFLGEDRLQYLVGNLKELARSDQKSARPVVLLSYIAYNTGNERRAAAYLDLADKRSDGKDPFIKLLRQHWALPTDAGSGDELNK